jgi:hypothetical protein
MKQFCLACLLGTLSMLGCGGSSTVGSGGESQNSTITSGNWYVETTSTAVPGTKAYIGGSLIQSGSTISGITHIENSVCYDLTQNVPFSGGVNRSLATLTSGSVSGQIIKVKATINNANTMTGTYSITGGCAGGDSGSTTATHVPSISGSWTATENGGGGAITVTGSIVQQATATSDGIFPLSGTLTFINSPCATDATIDSMSSFIVGDLIAVVANVNEVGGGQGHLEYYGYLNNPSTAKSLIGSYNMETTFCSAYLYDLNFVKQ